MVDGEIVTGGRRGHVVELHIPSQLGWECVAMDVAASVAARMGFPPDRVEDIKTAVSEAALNAIEHGNAFDATQAVNIILVPEEEALQISVQDHASRRFDPAMETEAAPNLREKLAGLSRPRGWGTFLIKELVDEVEFSSTRTGNLVRMVIHLER